MLLAVPAAAAANGKIVFVSERDSDLGEIYVMDPDGSNLTRVTNNSYSDDMPAWSPDGTRIAFTSSRDSRRDVYVMNADGSGTKRLTKNGDGNGFPAWSYNGTKIAYVSIRSPEYFISVMNADGSGQARLTGPWTSEPDWSPDGRNIVFVSEQGGNPDICRMKADGTVLQVLTTDTGSDEHPAWSPDGTKIAFQSDRDGYMEIYVMNADGSNQTRLTNNNVHDLRPSWSPDGARIVFQEYRSISGGADICIMDAGGTNFTWLTEDPATASCPDWYGVRVSGIAPKTGKRGTTVTIRKISGSGFAPGAKVLLVNNTTTIKGRMIGRAGPQKISCTFRIPGTAPVGKWNLTVRNPDGVSGTLAEAFTVK